MVDVHLRTDIEESLKTTHTTKLCSHNSKLWIVMIDMHATTKLNLLRIGIEVEFVSEFIRSNIRRDPEFQTTIQNITHTPWTTFTRTIRC